VARRRPPNLTEKLAAALLLYWEQRGDGIPFRISREMTAAQICSLVEWHHTTPHAWVPSNHPATLVPLPVLEHREVTRKQAPVLAKVKRSLERRNGLRKPKGKIRSRGFPTKEERQRLREKYHRD
jgi:hypothetical protein